MGRFYKFYWGLLLLVIICSCAKIQEPQFRRLEDFRLKKLGIQESIIGLKATWFNPNSFGVSIKETTLDVYIDSVYLGKFIQPDMIGVLNKAEFSIPLEGKISIAQALKMNIPSLIGKEVTIKADGSVRIGKAGAFITKEISYQGKHILDNNLLRNPG
jgi:LEA14-like dessication related protein